MQVRLREYGTARGIPLTRQQTDAILGAGARLGVAPTTGRPGHYDLTAGSFVGSLSIGDLDLEIRPKVPIENLLFLLGYAADRKRLLPLPVGVATQPSIHEAASLFFDVLLRRAFARGLLQGYRQREEALMTVRGRLCFHEQLRRRPLQALPVECRYDEFTEDTEMNRVLRVAVRNVLGMRLRSRDLRQRLRAHEAELERARIVRYSPHDLPKFAYSRLDDHYRPAVEFALLLLRAQAPEPRLGGLEVRSMLFDMNQVFEDFLLVAMREALGLDAREFPAQCRGHALFLDEGRSVPLRPDLSWWAGDQCVWVGDAKYKRAETAQVHNSDVYQAVAYCHGTGLRRATLVYADGVTERRVIAVRGTGVSVELVPFSLDGQPARVLDAVREVATSARVFAERVEAHSRAYT